MNTSLSDFRILQQLTLECISTSPWLLIVFKPEELITYLSQCLMLWDHSEYHLLDTAQGINNSIFFFFFFLLKILSFHFGFKLKSLSSLSTRYSSPGLEDENVSSNVKHHFLFFMWRVDMQLQFIRTVNTCI